MSPVSCRSLLLLAAATYILAAQAAYDHCAAKHLCQPWQRHVACNGRRFGPACQKPKLIKLTTEYQDQILAYHNKQRNSLACGHIMRYAEARSMEKLQWHQSLSRMAEYNAKTCTFAHDECRNTRKFRAAGQNLYMQWYHGYNMTIDESIHKFLEAWHLEYRLGRQSMLDNYTEESSAAGIGHFTQMVHANTRYIGCAMVQFLSWENDTEMTHRYLVCNYSEGNIWYQPVYRKGKRCSGCRYGCSKGVFNCLCRR